LWEVFFSWEGPPCLDGTERRGDER
jgi:hypothetical protein